LQSRPKGQYSSDEATKGDSGVRIVECPNCKDLVPLSIYCLKCGYPMFELMKKYNSAEDAEGDEAGSGEKKDGNEEFRIEPEDLAPQVEGTEAESKPEEVSEAMDVDNQGSIDPIDPIEEEPEDVDATDRVIAKPPEPRPEEGEKGFEADEALQSLMRNLANSINMKLWSVGQLLEGRISEQNFERLHEGYDSRWRQLMDLRNERLAQARDLNSLEEGLERAYINLGELEVRKTLNDLFNGEYESKAPAYEWEISHFERQLEERRGEIAFLERLSNVVTPEELKRLTDMAKMYLEEMKGSEGLRELIDGTYSRLKASMEEIVAFLDENQ